MNSWHHHGSFSMITSFISGVINGTAPNPVRLAELCDRLGHVLGRPSWLPVPDFALKAVLGEGATVVRNHSWIIFSISVYLVGVFGTQNSGK